MFKKIERQIQIFTKATGMVSRQEIVHGTLYVKFNDDRDCDFFHKELRTFYRKFISADGGVNMYAVGDEFAFDFVPEDREAPVFSDEEYSGKEGMMPDDIDKGVWSEFAEEELLNNMEPEDSKVDTAMQLEIESLKGK
tara:strand:- start:384 stop:797 length:414 start_codon:yes stop_codon:yes gene_type:complete